MLSVIENILWLKPPSLMKPKSIADCGHKSEILRVISFFKNILKSTILEKLTRSGEFWIITLLNFEVFNLLNTLGFKLYDIIGLNYGVSEQLEQFDALFIKI